MNKFLLLFSFLVISCVPHKDMVYFQGLPTKTIYKMNNSPYKLKTGDIMSISIRSKNEGLVSLFMDKSTSNERFRGEDLYFNGYSIDNNGNIRLPYIGELNVLEYTTKEVREKIEIELKKYINSNDSFFVSVKLGGVKYTILGEIKNPGTNIINQDEVSIIEAISNSGDISEKGDRKNIEVIRNEHGTIKKYTIDITQISLFDSEVLKILPNDIIYVKPIRIKSWGFGTTGLDFFRIISTTLSVVTTTLLLIRTL